MTAFDALKEKIESTGLYDVKEGSTVYAEIMAYAEGLKIFYDALDELLRECFITTAESYGLTLREDAIHKYNLDRSIEGRRKSIMAALSINRSEFKYSSLQRIIDTFNIKAAFGINKEKNKIICSCSNRLTETEVLILTEQIKKFMPCWYGFEIVLA